MFKEYIRLCRPHQWYKNLLVFLALFFSSSLFNAELVLISVYAFFILVMISSANYVLNDIFDANKDKLNDDKKNRPIASGKIKIENAILFSVILILTSLALSLSINMLFFYSVLTLFILTLFYTIILKKIFLLDIFTISANFVVRAIAGAIVIGVFVSPWLVTGIFLFAIFLVTGKRYGESYFLGKDAEKHRHVLRYYTKQFTKPFFYSLTIMLMGCFFFFSFFDHPRLMWSFPIFILLLVRYIYIISMDKRIAANPEKALKDRYLLFLMAIFIIISSLLFYL